MQMTPELLMSLDEAAVLLIHTEWDPRRGDHVVGVSAADDRMLHPVDGWDVIRLNGDHFDHPAVLEAAEKVWARMSAHAQIAAMRRIAA